MLPLACLTAALASLAAVAAAEPTGPEVTFRFQVPGGRMEYTQRLATRRTRQVGTSAPRVDETVSETAIVIERSEDGYLLTARPLSSEVKRNGQRIDDELTRAMLSFEVTYALSADGRLLEVRGVREFLAGLPGRLPPAVAAAVRKSVTAEALIATETAEWEGRIGDYAGATVRVGEVWEALSPITLPNGEEMRYFNRISFAAMLPCGESRCLEILHEYTSDAAAITHQAGQILTDAAAGAGEQTASTGGSIRGSVRRLIEPDTMRVHSEHLERTIRMTMTSEGPPVETVQTETRDYWFTY